MRRRVGAAAVAVLLLLAGRLAAEPIDPTHLPESLRTWVPWVLAGHEQELCPPLGGLDERHCLWPGRLALELDEHGGRFTQSWSVDRAGNAPLPGEERWWPQGLLVDGKPAAALAEKGAPVVPLSPGAHTVAGSFRWDSLPEALQVPATTGIVQLTVQQAPVLFPERAANGRLFLRGARSARVQEDRLEVWVVRRLGDEIPAQLLTRVELSVSGHAREVLLASPLLPDFLPFAINSALPARLDPDGRLRVQVRPGDWTIDVAARHAGPLTAAGPAARAGGLWASEEIWVFKPQQRLRLVDVSGAPAVDPQQTRLPEDWKGLAAYRLRPGDTLRLSERRRGDQPPAADRLRLQRTLWLDFAGQGYTFQDRITGSLHGERRLEMAPPTRLERVVTGGRDQVVTRQPGSPNAGVEVRPGAVDLEAEGRLDEGLRALPAVGWDRDFETVHGDLNLPPGWRLLAASGVDEAPQSWLARWSLLDLFLVLIIALAVRQLWGNRWGILALAALVLIWQEPDPPTWEWLAVLAAGVLLRLLPAGRTRALVHLLALAATVALVLTSLGFLLEVARRAIAPVLEYPSTQVTEPAAEVAEQGVPGAPPPPPTASAPVESFKIDSDSRLRSSPAKDGYLAGRLLDEVDPNALVATGPGLPRWRWNHVELRWDGPIHHSQRLRLFLVPPWLNRLLGFLRIALVGLLLLRVLPWSERDGPRFLGLLGRRPASAAVMLAVASLGLLLAAAAARAETPSAEVLKELRERLLAKPACHPDCAAVSRLTLETGQGVLRARLEVGAAAPVAVPLPGGAQHWLPALVLVDGKPPAGPLASADGRLWVRLEPGRHEIQLEGPLPAGDSVVLALPLKPHRVDLAGAGWTATGVHEDGVPDDSIQLHRTATAPIDARATAAGASAPAGNALPPFLEVERTLHLGLRWSVETRVVRRSPAGTPAVVDVPLLPGESVTSPGVRVTQGKAQVSLGPDASALGWASDLAMSSSLALEAPRTLAWTEVWQLDAAPFWHVTARGVPPIVAVDEAHEGTPEWRPWPGERLVLQVNRPAGVPGSSVTIDRSQLILVPGARSTSATLDIDVRSSRGTQEIVTLPDGATLQSVELGGGAMPVRQEGRRVSLPIAPGTQHVRVTWREPRGNAFLYRTGRVDLGHPSVNAATVVQVAASRWVLLTGGPPLGPAVLFWALLLLLLLLAIALARLGFSPLRARDWLLLGVGLSQVPLAAAAAVAGWLLAVGWRRAKAASIRRGLVFDLLQVLLWVWGFLAIGILCFAVRAGLLGSPEMQVAGNASTGNLLNWFSDRAGALLPGAWFLSLPMLCYRVAMLAWALWLAIALLRWLRWVWQSLTLSGGWRRLTKAKAPAPPAAP